MTRCLAICPDEKLLQVFIDGLQLTPGVDFSRVLTHYPASTEAGRLLDSLQPAVIFIASSDDSSFAACVRRLEQLAPRAAIVGFAWQVSSAALLGGMRLGLREYASAPFAPDRLQEIVARVTEDSHTPALPAADGQRTFCFLPAKPGVGASTLARHTAMAMAGSADGQTALLDFDFQNGLITLGLDSPQDDPQWDPLGEHRVLNDALWNKLVRRCSDLDVFAVALKPDASGSTPARQSRELLRYVNRRYQTAIVDLPGSRDEDILEYVRRSHTTFLVASAEIASLLLAYERLAWLKAEGLADRVELLLNRTGKIKSTDVEQILGHPVYFDFPNQYLAANDLMGRIRKGPLARRLVQFAATLAGKPAIEDHRSGVVSQLHAAIRKHLRRAA